MHHYAAGLIDGEGYIGIQESGGSFQVRLKVSMTDKGLPALERMAATYGGKVYPGRQATTTNREDYSWVLTGVLAAEVIRMVKPHLLVKSEPAEVALNFQVMIETAEKLPNGRTRWTEKMRDKARYFKAQIQDANRRGPDPALPKQPNMKPFAKHKAGAWWSPDDSLFGPEPFTGTFPTSGTMRNGVAYELPTWEPHTAASGYSSLLPSVTVSDANGPGLHGTGGMDLRTTISMLPTPRATRSGSGTETMYRLGAERQDSGRPQGEVLLPTPVAQPSGDTPENHLRKKPGRQIVTDLSIIVENGLLESGGRLLPSPRVFEPLFQDVPLPTPEEE